MRRLAWLLMLPFTVLLAREPLQFTLHKHEGAEKGPTVLVIGGIQGDEPGGFHAASLLVSDYRVQRGTLWLVPNLNFESIVQRSRGLYGDMNRKFASLAADDPDRPAVERVQALISDPQVDFVINLHDGSGYFREKYLDRWHNPNRWGQSVIIDRSTLEGAAFPALNDYALGVATQVNGLLLDDEHSYRVHNTRTHLGDREMEKSLTYFAVRQGKGAIGLEASKNLPTHERAYYHLQLIEALLAQLGVTLQRDFPLTAAGVRERIDGSLQLALYNRRIALDLADARSTIRYLPLQRDTELEFSASSPLVALLPDGDGLRVSYGNRRMTRIIPEPFDFDSSLDALPMELDGVEQRVPIGTIVDVSERLLVVPQEGYRVNVIGWRAPREGDEAGYVIRRGEIAERFSVDEAGRLYRVEVYRGDRFSGMVLVRFGRESGPSVAGGDDSSSGEES